MYTQSLARTKPEIMKACFVTLSLIILSLLLSVCLPLFTYGTSLALFGLAHVGSELRYIDRRFGIKIDRFYGTILAALLLGIIATRVVIVFKLGSLQQAFSAELMLVFMLSISAFFKIKFTDFRSCLIAITIVLSFCMGFFLSPVTTLLIFAVLHNITPMGFIVELVPKGQKTLTILICSFIFIVLPLLIASGALATVVETMILIDRNFSILPTGTIDQHLSVFIPSHLIKSSWAYDAFSAVVFAQCMHYLAVIYIMPTLLKWLAPHSQVRPVFNWPRGSIFWSLIAIFTALLFVCFLYDFIWARSIYGIAAALHAYIEIPILLIAFLAATKISLATSPQALR